jgi:single-strand DNA-binding protein
MSDNITVIGNIATPPERKVTANGLVITSFRLATNDSRFDRQTNAWIDGEPNYFSVSIFRTLAENAYYSLHKGERIIVSGKLRIKQWETATTKGTTAEIDADGVGHDLQFGTTRFDKTPKRTSEPQPGAEPQPATGSTDEWAVRPLGLSSDDPAESDASEPSSDAALEPAPELELVGSEPPF